MILRMVKSAIGLLVLIAIIAALVRLFEARFAFFPSAGVTTTPEQFGLGYDPLTIVTRDGERLRAWVLRPFAPGTIKPRAQVLYFHGNGGNLSIWAPILAGIARQGYSVFAFDYRGYGQSSGTPSERGLYRDVDAVLASFWSQVPADEKVVYWGRSLGGAMAAYASTVRAPSGLILESGFPDVRTLLGASPVMGVLSRFSTYRFPAAEFLSRSTSPVLVIHGDSDRVIDIDQGRALFERIAARKRFVTIPGGDHNDVSPRDPRLYWEAVNEFTAGL
jgi:alpha-beta hydrolase superfamily lysophospholipase